MVARCPPCSCSLPRGSPLHLACALNPLQETHIIGVEVADVIDTILLQRYAIRAHAEGESAELGWVIAPVFQHARVYHASAEYFQPARIFAHGATLAVAQHTFYIHLHARFSEREVALAET